MCGSTGDGWAGCGRVLLATVSLLAVQAMTPAGAEPLVIDFESATAWSPPLGWDYWADNPGFTVQDAVFSGGSFNGFLVSSSTTTGVAGYLYAGSADPGSEAEISAQSNGGAGGGVDGSPNFAVGYYGGPLVINLPVGYRPASVSLTNTATAYWAILNGLYQAAAFKPGDWFRVTFSGYSAAAGGGSEIGAPVDFYLADFRGGQSLVVDSWTALDLSPLGEARSIKLSFASSDNNTAVDPPFDINTPAYVAIDNLTLMAVPEPGAAALVAAGVLWFLMQRGRWRNGRVDARVRS